MHKPCAVIPVYNHEHALPVVVAALHAAGLPCVLVDDASSSSCAAVMDQLAAQPDTHLVRLPVNQGKGGAVMAGLREAARLGFADVRAFQRRFKVWTGTSPSDYRSRLL